MATKILKSLSGVHASRSKLRKTYGTLSSFKHYCENYNIHGRLGYKTPENAWRANPLVESSVLPKDLCRVDKLGRRYAFPDAHWGVGQLSKAS